MDKWDGRQKCLWSQLNNSTRNPPIGKASKNAAALKFNPWPPEAAFSVVLSNFDKCRLEVADGVISCVAVY